MAKSQQNEKSGKDKFLESFSGFLYTNRVILVTILALLIAGLITLAVVVSVRQNRTEEAAAMSEKLQDHYTEWAELSEEEGDKKEELKQIILDTSEEIIETFPNSFAAQRGLLVAGEIMFSEESWDKSAEYFMRLAEGYPESYLAPVALAAAAAVYENAGMTDEALGAAETIVKSYADDSVEAPHAFFTVGRLREKIGDIPGALEVYRDLVGKFPESSWTKLAQDRIIVLEPEE